MADESNFFMSPGGGAAMGGAAGLVGGLMGMNQQRKQWNKMSQELNPQRMLDILAALYPQYQGFAQGGYQDLMASLIGGAQAAGGNAQNAFSSILGQGGMLGGGLQAGGNAALQLATGQNVNQARGQGAQMLAGMEGNAMQGVLARALGYGGLASQQTPQNPFIAGMQGAGLGAQMFQPKNQGGSQSTAATYPLSGFSGGSPAYTPNVADLWGIGGIG